MSNKQKKGHYKTRRGVSESARSGAGARSPCPRKDPDLT